MRTLVTGATGLIGRALLERLESAVVLTRRPARAEHCDPKVEVHAWSPEAGSPPVGALARMLTAFRLGAGGKLGDGRQWMPWIHLDDVVGILLHASRDGRIRGAMHAVGPRPVTNADFTRALGQVVHRPAFLAVPKIALRLAFGEMGQILTDSQRVLPTVAEQTGYAFKYPDLGDALKAVLG